MHGKLICMVGVVIVVVDLWGVILRVDTGLAFVSRLLSQGGSWEQGLSLTMSQ